MWRVLESVSCSDSRLISFTISGQPIPLKRHRSTRQGRMYDPSFKDKKDMWLQIAKFKPKKPLESPIYLRLAFYLKRPKYHFKTKKGKPTKIVKDRFLDIKYHSSKPDIDNLVKMIADVVQGKNRMIVDDSQICMLQAEKFYGKPRTEVVIQEVS